MLSNCSERLWSKLLRGRNRFPVTERLNEMNSEQTDVLYFLLLHHKNCFIGLSKHYI